MWPGRRPLLAAAAVVLGALSAFAQDGAPIPGSPTVTTDEGITNGSYTNKTVINFRAGGSKAGFPAYGCKLDAQGFSTCLNPQTYTGLSDGKHTLLVVFQRADGTRDIFPQTFTWTVDTVPPSLVMTSLPFVSARPKTNQRSVAFTFDTQLTSDSTGITYACSLQRLTGLPLTQTCNSKSVSYAGLGATNQDTAYNLTVTATDRAKNSKSITTPFWIDLLKPSLWIPAIGRLPTTIPPRYTNNTLATITFSSSEPGQVTYQCRRNGGIFQTCSDSDFSSTTYRSLPQGEHTFEIRATDWAGNLQTVFMLSRPVNYSNAFEVNTTTSVLRWRVDTTAPPKPQFVIRPRVQTNDVNPRFQFSLAGLQIGGVSFSCGISKPGVNYLNFPCFPTTDVATPASPVPGTHNNQLSYGPHTLRVNAIDAAGNHGQSNFYTFTIDLKAPTVVFNTLSAQVPPGPINNSPTMTFNFHAVDVFPERIDAVNHFNDITRNPCPLYNCTMQCRLQPLPGAWAPCVSPKTYTSITAVNVRESHTLSIRATDNATNIGAITTFTWITDRVPPTPSWVKTPPKSTNSSTATFTWKTTEIPSEPPTFRCRLDRGAWTNCTTPPAPDASYSWTLTKLSHHFNHLFEVEATDAFGNSAQNLPYTWQVDLVDPVVTPDKDWATQGVVLGNPRILGNNSHTNIQSVLFKFSSEPGAVLTCNIDSTGYRPCMSFNQQSYAGLANGVHTFRVQAEDPVGRKTPVDRQPYYRWIVDTVPPVTRFLEVPNRYTNKLTASVSATANEPTTGFQCEYRSNQFQFGQTSWLPCTGPPFNAQYRNNSIYVKLKQFIFSQTGVKINYEGNHTISIRATDLASNTGSATSYLWTVDIVPPIMKVPAGRSVQPDVFSSNFRWREAPDATFYFSTNEDRVNYTCYLMPSLNWTNPHICSSPWTYNNITIAGNYTFKVNALDAAGNYDPKQSSISFNWTADPFPPTTAVIDGPNYYMNRLTDLLFTLRVDVPRISFMCTVYKLHLNGSVMLRGNWLPCVDRQMTFGKPPSTSYSIRDVNMNYFNNTLKAANVDGMYRFGAQATDVFNRTSKTAWYNFVIDTIPPNTALEGTNPKSTNMNWISFSYFTTKQAYIHDRFECRLLLQNDRTLLFTECANSTYRCTWTECGRSTWKTNRVTGLKTAGVYRFEIRAVDKAGNIDMQPVWSQFIYQPTAPRVEILAVEPMNGTVPAMNDSLVYAFSGDEGISYTCYFSRSDVPDVNVTLNCKSPITYYPPPANKQRNGSLSSFTVSGYDVSGNTRNVTYTRHLYNVTSLKQRLAAAQNRPIPKECTNNDTTFAYVAVAFWVLFIVTIIVFPCAILRKMESKTPMKRRESRQPLTSIGNPTFRTMEEEY